MKKLKAVYQKMKEIFFRRLLKLEWPELYYINKVGPHGIILANFLPEFLTVAEIF